MDAFFWATGVSDRLGDLRLEMAFLNHSLKMGSRDLSLGPCASTAPRIVSEEVVVTLLCGQGRASAMCGDGGIRDNSGGATVEVVI